MLDYHAYSRYFDLSELSDVPYEFSPSCIVFHRDYKQEMKPITKGIGAYLVNNSSDAIYVPKTPSEEDISNEWLLWNSLA